MKIEFDPAKNEQNIAKRNLPFSQVEHLDWETASYMEDVRFPYPERRFTAVGFIGERLHVVCFTPIEGGIRVISFRKANAREVKRYEHQAADR